MTGRAPTSSSFNYQWTYDVFINFRGQDTRYGFTGHLYNAFRQKGIHAFMDDEELRKGDEITPVLLKAIEESRMAITVFSKNYASSTFCLSELVKIHQCIKGNGRLVWPIFYDVEPSEVRHQKGNYEESLTMHVQNFKADEEKMQSWKHALSEVANLSGLHIIPGQKYEYQCIESIVKEISSKINRIPLHIADYPVGLKSRVSKMNSLLEVGTLNNKVYMIGICGIGGVGKTTIARAVYNSIADHFEGLCFLHDIKEYSNKFGLKYMQERMLSKILGIDIKVEDVNEGVSIIKRRLAEKKVLLVLDNVDEGQHLQKLAGNCDWFGLGSRIIITTRDKQLLISHGIERIFYMNEFNSEESLELLKWKAFKSNQVDPAYMEVLNSAVQYAHGLPLALEVIGSHLFHKSIQEWKSALDLYRRIPNNDVQQILKVSYNSLEEIEQEIFLDIACFFKGTRLKYINDMVEYVYGFDPSYVIGVLKDKCLIKIGRYLDFITMHDLIEGMGREIVRQESPREPGERSRLWCNEDIIHVLENNTGTDKICFIIQRYWHKNMEIKWDGKAFKRMKNLKVLSLMNACFSKGSEYIPNSLKILQWRGYPASCLPTNFDVTRLAMLDLQGSRLKSLEPIKNWNKMRAMNFSGCQYITQVPDVSSIPNLIELKMRECPNLIEVDKSVGYLENLQVLDLSWCEKLKTFPSVFKLPTLRNLGLQGCSSLEKFPEILEEMKYMEELYLSYTNLELPYSIYNITGLQNLIMSECKGVILVPMLKLEVTSSEGYEEGQAEASSMLCSNVTQIILEQCNISDEFLPICLSLFANVKLLDLSDTNFMILPVCIKECRFLHTLYVRRCKYLREIKGIPSNLQELWAEDCTALSTESKSILFSKELHEVGGKEFCVIESTLPTWLDKRSRRPSISFWFRNQLPLFSLWFLGQQITICNSKHLSVLCYGWDQISLDILPTPRKVQTTVEIKKPQFLSEWNHVEICIDLLGLDNGVVKEMGVHVIRKPESCMEDIRFTHPYKRAKFDDLKWNSSFAISTWSSGSGTPTLTEAKDEPSVTSTNNRESKLNKKRKLKQSYGNLAQNSINEDELSNAETSGTEDEDLINQQILYRRKVIRKFRLPTKSLLDVKRDSYTRSKKDREPKLNKERNLKELYGNLPQTSMNEDKSNKEAIDTQPSESITDERSIDVRRQDANMKDKGVYESQNMKHQQDETLISQQISTSYTSNEEKSDHILEVTGQSYRFFSNGASLTWDPMEWESQVTCIDPLDKSTNISDKGHDGRVFHQSRDPGLKDLCCNFFTFVASLCCPSS